MADQVQSALGFKQIYNFIKERTAESGEFAYLNVEHVEKLEPPDVVQHIYRWLVCNICNCPEMNLIQTTFFNHNLNNQNINFEDDEEVDKYFDADTHEKSMPLMNLVLAVDYILGTLSIEGFNLQYLTNASIYKKGQRYFFMSHLINLINFCDTVTGEKVHKVMKDHEAVMEEKKQILEDNAMLKGRLASAREREAEEDNEREKLKKRNDNLKLQMKKKTDAKAMYDKMTTALAGQLDAQKLKLSEMEKEVARLKAENIRLDDYIISSPQKLQGRVEALNRQKQQIAVEYQSKIDQLRRLKTLLDEEYPKIQCVIRDLDTILDDLTNEKSTAKTQENEAEELKKQIQNMQFNLAKAVQESKLENRQYDIEQKKANKHKSEHEAECAKVSKQISNLQRKIGEIERVNAENEVASSNLEEHLMNLRDKLHDIRAQSMEKKRKLMREVEYQVKVFEEKTVNYAENYTKINSLLIFPNME